MFAGILVYVDSLWVEVVVDDDVVRIKSAIFFEFFDKLCCGEAMCLVVFCHQIDDKYLLTFGFLKSI